MSVRRGFSYRYVHYSNINPTRQECDIFQCMLPLAEFLDQLYADTLVGLEVYDDDIPVMPSLARFTSLQKVILIRCRLEHIPPSTFSENKRLTELVVEDNPRLTHLPDLRSLRHLHKLTACCNALMAFPLLPRTIRVVELHNNLLRKIPRSIPFLFQYLNLDNNPIMEWNTFDMALCQLHDVFTADLSEQTNQPHGISFKKCPLISFMEHMSIRQLMDKYHVVFQGNMITDSIFLFSYGYQYKLISFYPFRALPAYWHIDTSVLHNISSLLMRIRRFMYLAKCRHRLRRWLYDKVIGPMNEKKYHPDKLHQVVALHEEQEDIDINVLSMLAFSS